MALTDFELTGVGARSKSREQLVDRDILKAAPRSMQGTLTTFQFRSLCQVHAASSEKFEIDNNRPSFK
jgi:hypothetical protein